MVKKHWQTQCIKVLYTIGYYSFTHVIFTLAEIGPVTITTDPKKFQYELRELYVQVSACFPFYFIWGRKENHSLSAECPDFYIWKKWCFNSNTTSFSRWVLNELSDGRGVAQHGFGGSPFIYEFSVAPSTGEWWNWAAAIECLAHVVHDIYYVTFDWRSSLTPALDESLHWES